MSINNKLLDILKEINGLEVKKGIPLKQYTSFKIGGPAELFLVPSNITALKKAVKILFNNNLPYFVLGRGSNIIVSDKGYNGVVIYLGKLDKITVEETRVTSECGVTLARLAGRVAEAGLTGLEFASGIPGSLGGALYMNAGAYGGEMKDVVKEVVVVDKTGKEISIKAPELKFSYRHSVLQEKHYIAVKAVLELKKGNREKIKTRMKELNEKRKQKQPLEWPSAGSAFKRPEGYYAGKLIEDAGLKGLRVGDAQVSTKHAGFIINLGEATASDVRKLMNKIQQKVYDKNGVLLEPEPKFIGDFE
ncbi:UDP-N-acetylmuramate dehydrogenase [Halothermothrix orenii]|uniref:UDP-N-acetylenolpyruvoylglucosamine reductase n=1 Tax=Halothermothrix orenii (strain H 168 / OCM 544 / DSM 9562) TaxID=373903 RepID=B8D0M8_HALOH|nr:UDP-N-acetylmuramate dehydrogenase [Halothermothrix orenii]ACL70964.1 UDP-N-acetylenolpyruvoylglucosamine reductase [Halothermothrix orenii H 168]